MSSVVTRPGILLLMFVEGYSLWDYAALFPVVFPDSYSIFVFFCHYIVIIMHWAPTLWRPSWKFKRELQPFFPRVTWPKLYTDVTEEEEECGWALVVIYADSQCECGFISSLWSFSLKWAQQYGLEFQITREFQSILNGEFPPQYHKKKKKQSLQTWCKVTIC